MLVDTTNIVLNDEKEFLDLIKGYVDTGTWSTTLANYLELVPASKIKISDFDNLSDVKAFEDTAKNTGLYIKIEGKEFPVGKSAMKSIMDRCRVSGSVFREMSKPDLTKVLNTFLMYANGDALIRFANDKVRAVLAGETNGYSIINMFDVFKETQNYLNKEYADSAFIQGTFTHELAVGKWEIVDNRISDLYKGTFKKFTSKKICGIVTVSDSDTGHSGANIYVSLKADNLVMALGKPIKCEHKGASTLADYEMNLKMILSKINESVEKINSLSKITVKHPNDTVNNMMKRVGLGKKYISAVWDYRKMIYSNPEESTNAKDLYLDICSILEFADGKSDIELLNIEERIGRIMSLNIPDYDYLNKAE